MELSGTEYETALSSPEERPVVKNELKQLLYRILSAHTGKQLPWGTLTGIRPTKIAMQFLEAGTGGDTETDSNNPSTEAEILDYMKETYYCSEEKALLAIDIAKREKRILADIHYDKGYSLYIGIPFCPYYVPVLFLYFFSHFFLERSGRRLSCRPGKRNGFRPRCLQG